MVDMQDNFYCCAQELYCWTRYFTVTQDNSLGPVHRKTSDSENPDNVHV